MAKIIITGVSRGIGNALTKHLLKEKKHDILGISRNLSALNELHELAKASGSSFFPLNIDISKESNTDNLIEFVKENDFNPDIMINNAAAMLNKKIIDIEPEDFDALFKVNVKAPFFLIRSLIPYFSSNAHIVNITSMGGVQGSVKFPGLSVYSMSKGALNILTETFAEELKQYGIKINSLALGAVQTEMLQEAFPGYSANNTSDDIAEFIAGFSLKGHRYFNGKVLPVALSTP